jgi:pilus assembly protein TadC
VNLKTGRIWARGLEKDFCNINGGKKVKNELVSEAKEQKERETCNKKKNKSISLRVLVTITVFFLRNVFILFLIPPFFLFLNVLLIHLLVRLSPFYHR